MNTLGKILIFTILVASVLFMGMAVAVYSTHRNWREVVELPADQVTGNKKLGLKFVIDDLQKQKKKLADEHAELTKILETERTAKNQALAKLEEDRKELEARLTTSEEDRNKLADKDKDQATALQLAQKNLAMLTDEVTLLRTSIRDAQGDRDVQFNKVVSLTDQTQQYQGELERLKERGLQLVADLTKAKSKLDALGIKMNDPAQPLLVSEVKAVNANKMIEIGVGSDDGVASGMNFFVFRGSKYLAKIEVMSVDTDHAVGKVLGNFDLAPIQEGDRVTNRFKG